MRIHVLGICGTFMGGLAALARELGLDVEGSDKDIYPPMSTQLEQLGIALKQGYVVAHLQPPPDLVVVGNAMSRGNAAVEHLLDAQLRYVSGPQWLGENVLPGRRVTAVAGTHGKTTTTAMLAWIHAHARRDPGFLVGGVPENFGVSARLGSGRDFVVEADEYDTAFFDKRSKFVHYRPWIAVLNNLEYDHADIFPDVAAIQRQFHHLVRIVPRAGRIVANGEDARLAEVLAMGCWTPVERFAYDDATADWRAGDVAADGSSFDVLWRGERAGRVEWPLLGRHNVMNALAAVAAANAAGVAPAIACDALCAFRSARRRLERVAENGGIVVYDDFAHHPTAIATTLAGLRARLGASARILVGMEPRSNSMRAGAHAKELAPAFRDADAVVFLR
ncbi:MAG TPA: UDP-N-acetylmuramate:L-alanyl-gamma-D-glutamyl-meso-diaminopimelate ligase, partial [Xanthomonadales bacterium]|nr:UDP-N-acetylmuramate:L-alanyl-gamma-D-glutamyl-meso-diaminopimelate ligase [Xanthomonadales bacterium]